MREIPRRQQQQNSGAGAIQIGHVVGNITIVQITRLSCSECDAADRRAMAWQAGKSPESTGKNAMKQSTTGRKYGVGRM